MNNILGHLPEAVSMLLFSIGLMNLLLSPNLIKKNIGLGIMDSSIYLFLALKGYIAGRGTPIVPADPSAVIDTSLYINPIPTGLVLTGIVVSVSVTAFFLSLTVRLYEDYNTVRIDEILIKIHAKEEKKAKGVHEE